MSENIKKGIFYTALGFLLILVNINLDFGSVKVNIIPEFLGWILIVMAIEKLGDYTSDKPYLRYIGIALIVLNALKWGLSIIRPDSHMWYVNMGIDLISVIFTYVYFDVLRQVAEDGSSAYTDKIVFLRWVHVAVYLAGAIIDVFAGRMTAADINAGTAAMILGYGVVALAVAIYTVFVLFRLNKEIKQL